MKSRLIASHWLCSLALVVIAAPLWAATAEGKFTRSLQVSGAVDLDVRTGAGNITVHSGGSAVVQVTGTIRAEDNGLSAQEKVRRIEANPPIEQNGSTIRIGHTTDHDLLQHVSISYDLVVPADTRLRSQNGSGNQTVDGVRGPVEATTGAGNLEISRIAGEVRARSGAGNIRLDSLQGGLQAHAGSGEISGRGITGPVSASTGSGNIRLEQSGSATAAARAPAGATSLAPQAGGNAGGVATEVRTGSGNVELSGVRGALQASSGSGGIRIDGDPAGGWNLHSGSGSIRLRLPAQAAFDFQAHTASGRISINHPLTVQGTIGRREVQGKVRNGGPLVSARTASGDIEVQ